ncbi:MAG: hypothetical protein HYY93_07495 [Planctomycetes bacterium]|nr:hypothetical protein [Planctomycetota bacterium]
MESVKIVVLGIVAAVLYGIVHDLITARVCVEYFTLGHPRIIDSDSPTALGFFWGVWATWWMGAALGGLLAAAARGGAEPKLGTRDLVRPIAVLLAVMAATALTAGFIGFRLAPDTGEVHDRIVWLGVRGRKVPLFFADLCAHNASYATALIGGLVLCARTRRLRRRMDPVVARNRSLGPPARCL